MRERRFLRLLIICLMLSMAPFLACTRALSESGDASSDHQPNGDQGKGLPAPVQAALIGAVVAGLFTLVNFSLVRRKEGLTRREEASLRHLQRQIEELYGPLSGLLQQMNAVYRIAVAKLWQPDGTMVYDNLGDQDKRLWLYLLKEHFLPLNLKAAELIRSKSFLLDSVEMPEKVAQFLRHTIEFYLVNKLWEGAGVGASFIDHTRFPKGLDQEVEKKLAELRGRYAYYLQRLSAERREASLDALHHAQDEAPNPDGRADGNRKQRGSRTLTF